MAEEPRYQQLLVWQRTVELASFAYRLTATFPAEERFGLCQQIRRSATSIPSNIAEGQGRLTRGEFRQFPGIARGSLSELETQFRIAVELGFLDRSTFSELSEVTAEASRMLNGLIGSLE